jgi:plasmid rolling circle replication initiator protein Rep
MSYYNTTKETGENLKNYQAKANNQKEKILSILTMGKSMNPNFTTSASRLNLNCPITSVRRAISDLVSEGLIEYTGEKRTGKYGRPENIIKLT